MHVRAEVFASSLPLGPLQLRKVIGQYLKLEVAKRPEFGITPATVDGMFDHPAGPIAKSVYERLPRSQYMEGNTSFPIFAQAYVSTPPRTPSRSRSQANARKRPRTRLMQKG